LSKIFKGKGRSGRVSFFIGAHFLILEILAVGLAESVSAHSHPNARTLLGGRGSRDWPVLFRGRFFPTHLQLFGLSVLNPLPRGRSFRCFLSACSLKKAQHDSRAGCRLTPWSPLMVPTLSSRPLPPQEVSDSVGLGILNPCFLTFLYFPFCAPPLLLLFQSSISQTFFLALPCLLSRLLAIRLVFDRPSFF